VPEQLCTVGGVELCYETFGDPADRPLLLIMGLGTQMVAWHEDFCAELAGRGFFVTRYDNRDVGRSTRFDDVPPPGVTELFTRRPKQLAYTLSDMAGDAAGLIRELGFDSAHVVGASMGGMIGQMLAIEHRARVRSFVSIMSTTGSRFVGQPAAAVYPFFMKPMPKSKEERDLLERSYERGLSPQGTMRQLAAITASGNRTRDLRRIVAPTLVMHGTKDKMVRVSGGKATARAIPGARLELIDGMGHDMPRAVWPRLIDGIEATAERAAEPAAAAA
jgi:pimeloyl-ACP methyl ester carboxylesterase